MDNYRFSKAIINNYEKILSARSHYTTLREKLAKAISESKFSDSLRILEIGPGRGESTDYLLKLRAKTMLFIEANPDYLDYLSWKSNISHSFSIQNEGVGFDYSDAVTMSVKPDVYNIFTSSWVIHNFSRNSRISMLKRVYNILVKGGLFATIDKYYPDDTAERTKLFSEQTTIDQNIGLSDEEFNEFFYHELEDFQRPYLMTESSERLMMEKIGFSNIKFYRVKQDALVTAIKK